MHWCLVVIKLLIAVALFSVEALFWLGHGVRKTLRLLLDVAIARKSLPGGVLHCPRGHRCETEGGRYQCTRCGFVYAGGSIWLCPNRECRAVTPYIECSTCGVSIPSPYRLGLP